MLKTIAIIAAVVAVAIAALLIYAATKPDTFRYARSTTIKAPPQKIFPLINDLQAFKQWSPYENKDPEMKRTISAPSAGKGATYAWEGNGNVGAGKMTIAASDPAAKVAINLDMLKPFAASNLVEFTLVPVPQGDATLVTWAMQGQNIYVGKVMSIFMDMDKMVGGDFETGLANLKRVAER